MIDRISGGELEGIHSGSQRHVGDRGAEAAAEGEGASWGAAPWFGGQHVDRRLRRVRPIHPELRFGDLAQCSLDIVTGFRGQTAADLQVSQHTAILQHSDVLQRAGHRSLRRAIGCHGSTKHWRRHGGLHTIPCGSDAAIRQDFPRVDRDEQEHVLMTSFHRGCGKHPIPADV